MFNTLLLVWGLVFAQAAGQASGTFVGKAQIDDALKKAVAGPGGNIVDQKISTTPIEGGKAHVAHLRRVQAETSALIHDHVTEIYYILEGAGTLMTGGAPRESEGERPHQPRSRHEPHRHTHRRDDAESRAR
jgi:hypothetical protein